MLPSMLSTCDKQSVKRVVSCSCEPGQQHILIHSFSILLLRGYLCAQLQTIQRQLIHGHTVWQTQHIHSCQAYPCILRRSLTAAKAVRPEEASHRASMKSRVAPKVLCLRRGDEGGDMTSGSGDTCSRPWDPSSPWDLCLSILSAKLHRTDHLSHTTSCINSASPLNTYQCCRYHSMQHELHHFVYL